MAAAGAGRVVAVDKAADRLAAAAAAVPGADFRLCDVLAAPGDVSGGAYDAVFVDINGSRAYDAVAACVAWAEAAWPRSLVVVKSSEYVKRHFPESAPANAPARQRA